MLKAVREAADANDIWVHLGSLALAGDRRQVRQSRLRHRRPPAKSGRATTRSICSMSICRPARAGASWRSMRRQRGGAGARHAGRAARPDDLLRPPLPGLVRAIVRSRRGGHRGTGGLHRADRQGALGSPAAGEGDRGRAVHRRRGARRPATRTAARPMAISWSSTPGAKCCWSWRRAGGVHFAEIELGRISEVRSRVPALKHRRKVPADLD